MPPSPPDHPADDLHTERGNGHSREGRRSDAGIRIAIASDHALFREAVRTLLDSQEDLRLVGEAGDSRQALDLAKRVRPDILLLDGPVRADG
ncbi:MAG TPA: hypothetical protein VG106_16045, partial [Vicinamibacterales bacterium]|nr:hypothetical protein [Vicinamibacterales bacterium]